MKLKRNLFSLIAASAFALAGAIHGAQPAAVRLNVDWQAFLGQQDMVWEQLPRQWNEGAFLGNGQLGLMVYGTLASNRIDFHLGRVDVTDHRGAPDRKTSRAVPGATVMWDFPRLDIGRIALHPAGKIKDGNLRLDLWNAEVTGCIGTDLGEIRLRVVTLRDRMVDAIEIHSTERTPDGRPASWRWEFLPGNPASPRAQVFPSMNTNYVTNPNPKLTILEGVPVCVQSLLAGGDYATAWLEKKFADGASGVLYVSTANEVPATNKSAGVAVKDVQAAVKAGLPDLLKMHRAWWHDFYERTFLTVPDARLEAFYYIQLYKLASASRPDAPPMDVMGPFNRVMQWPGLWWNLNVQLAYWITYTGNHLDLGQNLITEIDSSFDGLLASFLRTPAKLGDLTWVLHNYWLHQRYAGDWTTLEKSWLPKAKAVFAGYRPLLKPTADGKLELLPMESPEYEGFKTYPNSNYNLALLRWLLRSMIEVNRHAGAHDADAAEWQRVLDKLVAPPVDENGLRIGSNQPVGKSHRHYSHVIGLYPLFVFDPDNAADRELGIKTVQHWHHIQNGKELTGYSYTGGSSLYSALGLGDEAYAMLRHFLKDKIGISALLANTMYVESGGLNPTLETPLTAASATMDLLLQSWGGKIRVFPAVPTAWANASFHRLRAQGAFVVSAVRSAGRTDWVAIQSEAGESCVLKVPDWSGPLAIAGGASPKLEALADGEYRIGLRKGESVILHPRGNHPSFNLKPLPIADAERNIYGFKRGGELKSRQTWPERPLPQTTSPMK
jgi:alpha-L-fucosidase 2